MGEKQKIGIFGGTFDPPDKFHIELAKAFVEKLSLDKCFLIPANVSPFKAKNLEKYEANAFHRLEMTKLAVKDVPKLFVDDREIRNKGVSYAIDTVKRYRAEYPDAELFLLAGMDQASAFDKWKDWRSILKLARLCVVPRPGYENETEKTLKKLTLEGVAPVFIEIKPNPISATEIRRRIKEKKDVSEFLDEKVLNYIRENSLYV